MNMAVAAPGLGPHPDGCSRKQPPVAYKPADITKAKTPHASSWVQSLWSPVNTAAASVDQPSLAVHQVHKSDRLWHVELLLPL